MARKIASSKTYIDDAGKMMVAEWKEQARVVDKERAKARDFLDGLKDEIRQPLVEFEERDKRRIAAHEAALASLEEYHAESRDYTVESAQAMLVKVAELRQRDWEEFAQRAKNVLRNCEHFATIGLDLARKREAEAAELARLRKETAERDQRERDERIAREAAERARTEAEDKARREAAEAARLAAEAEERAAKALRESEERARKEEAARIEIAEAAKRSLAAAQAEREERERQRVALAEKVERDRIDAEARAEFNRIAAVEAERKVMQGIQRAAEEEAARRKADRENRENVNAEIHGAISDVLRQFGTEPDVDLAEMILQAIERGDIPHLTINY